MGLALSVVLATVVAGALLMLLRRARREIARLERATDERGRELRDAMLDAAQQPMLILDGELRVEAANHAFTELFRLVPEETIGRRLAEIGGGEWNDPALLHALAKREPGAFHFEANFGRAGRHALWLRGRRLRHDGYSLLLAVDDETERRRADEAVRYQASLLRAAQDAIIATDVAFNMRSWNPSAERIFGWRDSEVIGRSIVEVLRAEMSEEQRLELRQLLLDGKPFLGEVRVQTKDGAAVEIETSAVALRDADCRIVGVVAVLREVGERKRLEQAIQEHAAQLEERGRQLEEANRELDGFTYSVSHDLRAPLRAVDGFSRILVEDYGEKLDDEGRRVLDVICKNTQKMGQLIDDLLAFSRMARKFMQPEPVDMAALVQTTIEEVSETGRAIDFRIGALPEIGGDAAMLKQVWVNLIGNAVKYTRPRERAVIEVACNTENGELIYSVKDNGVGFDAQYIHKLFGVFQRLHAANEFEGTGVGLALVQKIVQRHRGRVWADGRVGEGAKFSFALPRKDAGHEA